MKYTFPIEKENMVTARSTVNTSFKKTSQICSKMNRKKFKDAKVFLNKLLEQKVSINGRYHTKAAEEMMEHLVGVRPDLQKYQCSLINVGPDDMLNVVLAEYARARKAGKGE